MQSTVTDSRSLIVNELNEGLVEFFDRFSSWESSIIEAGNLKIADAHAIEILGHYGRMNMKELASRLGLTTGTTTITVDRLERGGYAGRIRAEHDRRSYIIELTPAGVAAYEEHHRHHLSLAQEINSVLGDGETEQFVRVLRKINESI
jgi:DNA-binding MarR family transcriptional regulator